MSCACRSVGKPGNGCVSMVIGSRAAPLRAMRMPCRRLGDGDAGLLQRARRPSRAGSCARPAARRRRRPPPRRRHRCRSRCGRAARCARRLRAGSRPGCAASRCRCPRSCAPILTRHSATSPISGSRAAFSITVSPLASAAAISTVWVAPTETFGNTMRAPLQALRRLGDDVAAVDVDLGAQRLQRHQVQVDRPRADGAAARQRDARLAAARQQRAQHPEARAHAADQLVGRGGVDDVARGQMEGLAQVRRGIGALAVDGEVDAVVAQDARQQVDVGEVRHVLQGQPVGRQQARDHQRQGRVLGAGDRDGAVQRAAAGDADAIHMCPVSAA